MLGFSKKTGVNGATGPQAGTVLSNDQSRFEIIVNSIEDGVILIDKNLTIQLMNPGAAALTGWPINEGTGINVELVMKLVDDKGVELTDEANPLKLMLKNKATIKGTSYNMINRGKQQFPLSFRLSPLLDPSGEISAAIIVFSDISEQRAEEQRRADFISTASHEMRTPVAAIEGYLALALNPKVSSIDNAARNYLEKAHTSAQHLGQLFQDLLTSAKAEDGRLTSHPTAVELGAMLEQVSNDLKFTAEKKGLFMEFASHATENGIVDASHASGGEKVIRPLYYVYADPDRLREVITNLFDNAVKYTPEGKITIGLTGNDQVVQCYVRDTGPGIPSQDIPHLFQKFYRVDNSATRTIGGTGLGLFISRKIIELYNGRIWAESEMGKGTTFYINLPRITSQKAGELQNAAANSTELKPIDSLAFP